MLLSVARAFHRSEQRLGDVLEREIEVWGHDGVGSHLFEETVADLTRVQIEQSETAQTVHIGEEGEKVRKPTRGVDIAAVGCEILSDQKMSLQSKLVY